jgi:hypothetical protein
MRAQVFGGVFKILGFSKYYFQKVFQNISLVKELSEKTQIIKKNLFGALLVTLQGKNCLFRWRASIQIINLKVKKLT